MGRSVTTSPHIHGDHLQTSSSQKIEDFLSRLEEERVKIDAFKRELPLCMQLLNNGTYIIITHHQLLIYTYIYVLVFV